MLNKILSGILIVTVITQINLSVIGQTTEEVTEAENRAKIAEAKRKELDALFPKPDVGSLVGGTKVNEGTFIESQMLGYCAMKGAAQQISTIINGLPKNAAGTTNLVVYNDADVKMLSRYMIMKNHLGNLENSYVAERDDYITAFNTLYGGYALATAQNEVNTARSAIPAIVDIALKSLSLFKTDIELTPSEVTIGEREIVAEVFSNLQGYTLYYPQTIPLSIQDCAAVAPATCSPLLDQIKATNKESSLVAYLKDTKLKQILEDRAIVIATNKKIANGTATPAEIGERTNIIGRYSNEANLLAIKDITDPISSRVEKLNILFNSAMKELGIVEPKKDEGGSTQTAACPGPTCNTQTTNVNVNVGDKEEKKDEGGGGKTFGSYLQTEKLIEIMNVPNSRFIELKVVKAGGNMRVKSNIITNLMIGSRVNFSGGAIVYYNVFNRSGASEKSGVIQVYKPYRKSSRIDDTCNTKDKSQKQQKKEDE